MRSARGGYSLCRMRPQLSDLVIEEEAGSKHCSLSIFPCRLLAIFINYSAAFDAAARLAAEQRVDVWRMLDAGTFACVARHRSRANEAA
jgi:hypothetical protein